MGKRPDEAVKARRMAHSARTATALTSLAGRVEQLGHRHRTEQAAKQRPAGPRMLIRADVLDLLTEIHALIEETAPLARAFQPARPGLVPLRDRLLLVASVLPQLAQLNPEIYEAVSLKVWDLGQRVSDAVGEYDAPAPVAEECPRCGRTSLWISPVRGLVACIEDGCRASVWPADTPLE